LDGKIIIAGSELGKVWL